MRYLPLSDADRSAMLQTIGAATVDDLFRDVPADALLSGPIEGFPLTLRSFRSSASSAALARKNLSAGEAPFFLGCGAYKHHIPASVDHIIQRGEFLTAYTPYQPEIAQGTLQVLFEFQTQVARLLWLRGRKCVDVRRLDRLLGSDCHGAADHAAFEGDPVIRASPALRQRREDDGEVHWRRPRNSLAGAERGHRYGQADRRNRRRDQLLSWSSIPTSSDGSPIWPRSPRPAHAKGALLIAVVTEPVALGLIRSPGEMGADIVVGEGQSIGVGLQFGGPYVGLFATREKYVRQMPGRLAGETVDAEGKRGFVLTLSTREQHIRREKATSNICTNSGLCALAFSVHMSLLGEKGLRQLAQLKSRARVRGCATGWRQSRASALVNDSFFNEFTVELPVEARPAVRATWPTRACSAGCRSGDFIRRERASERADRRGHRDRDRRGYRGPGSWRLKEVCQ